MPINLKILSPEKVILDKDVDYIGLETVDGSMGVEPGHASLAAKLIKSSVVFQIGSSKETIEINGGFARIEPKCVTLFAD